MVPAIILAAGRSARMGRPKALLPLPPDGATFVERLSRTLVEAGAGDVLIVGRSDDAALASEVDRLNATGCSVRFVENAHADRGQLSSVLAGLNAADRPGVHGLMVIPVDAPLVRAATIAALLEAFYSRHPPVVRATFRGRHGHPVIFARTVFDELRRADAAIGAKAVVRAHAADLLDVDQDDPAIVQDVDDPDDFARLWSDTGASEG